MKKRFIIVVSVLLIGIALFGACSTNTTTTSAPASTIPAATTAAPEKQIIVRFSTPIPPRGVTWDSYTAMFKDIETASNNRIKVEMYAVGVLVKAQDHLTAVKNGVVEIAQVNLSMTPGLFNKSAIFEYPGFPTDLSTVEKIYQEISEKYCAPEFTKQGVKLMFLRTAPTKQLYTVDSLPSFQALQGVKASAPNEAAASILSKIGMAPSIMAGADTYLSLQKGVVRAAYQNHSSARTSKYEEITKYFIQTDFPSLALAIVINPSFFNDLTPDLQKILTDGIKKGMHQCIINDNNADNQDRDYLLSKGIKETKLSTDDMAKIQGLLSSSAEEWIALQTKNGMQDAKEYVQIIQTLTSKYK